MRLYVIILKYLELDKNMENSYKIWFTSDTHFFHRNILKFQKERREIMGITDDMSDTEKLHKHNEWIINMWNMTVKKEDHIYILGDVSFGTTEETKKILERLKGHKHLIIGNHDKSCRGLENYFVSVSQIKEFPIKKHQYDFLEENIYLVLCHFPMVAWNRRLHGAFQVHGHTHNSLKDINNDPWELIKQDVQLDDIVSGEVVRIIEKGAIVKIREGVDAFLPISELSEERVIKVSSVVNIGDTVNAMVIEFKPKNRRMVLSIKEANREPEEDYSEYLETEDSLGSLGELFKDKFKNLQK